MQRSAWASPHATERVPGMACSRLNLYARKPDFYHIILLQTIDLQQQKCVFGSLALSLRCAVLGDPNGENHPMLRLVDCAAILSPASRRRLSNKLVERPICV